MPRDQQAKKEVTLLAGAIGPGHQEKAGVLLFNGGRGEYIWHPGNLFCHLLVFPCPILIADGQVQQPWSEQELRPLKDDDLGHHMQPSWPTEVLAKGGWWRRETG